MAGLPGLRPGDGSRPGIENRPGREERRERLQDRLNNRDGRLADRSERRGDRAERAEDRMADRRDRYQERRDNWNDWYDRHYHHHDYWYHGHGHPYWGPGYWWNYWWDNYPVLSTFGLTTWAINRAGWAFGYYGYTNPYYGGGVVIDNSVYNYSQPIVMTPDETSLAASPADTSPPEPPPEAMSKFETAQQQFYAGDYQAALSSANEALKQMPNDAAIHEFRALVLFALGKYQDAAATLYAVLSVGPGWDWTTMSSLYPDVAEYTKQLRRLEAYRQTNPQDAAAAFVLAYHYITCDHKDAAVAQLEDLVKLKPKDQLASDLLLQLDPDAKVPDPPEVTKPPEAVAPVQQQQVQGKWKAVRPSGESFEMSLDDKGEFTWKFTSGKNVQEVKGVYALDKDGVLALEMNDEGVMLAQLDLKGRNMDFYMLGDTNGTPPLRFSKQ